MGKLSHEDLIKRITPNSKNPTQSFSNFYKEFTKGLEDKYPCIKIDINNCPKGLLQKSSNGVVSRNCPLIAIYLEDYKSDCIIEKQFKDAIDYYEIVSKNTIKGYCIVGMVTKGNGEYRSLANKNEEWLCLWNEFTSVVSLWDSVVKWMIKDLYFPVMILYKKNSKPLFKGVPKFPHLEVIFKSKEKLDTDRKSVV